MNDPLEAAEVVPAPSPQTLGVGSLQDTPDTTTGDVVERAKAALEGVPDGPWTVDREDGEPIIHEAHHYDSMDEWYDVDGCTGGWKAHCEDLPTAEFVAAARSLVPELIAEVERLHSWDGLMSLLDEHWPEDIFPTLPDTDRRDPGPRIVSLLRWVDKLKAQVPTVNYTNHFCPKGCDCSCCYGYSDRSCHCFADPCNCGGDRQAHGQKPLP